MSENTFSLRSEACPVPYWKHHRRSQESINFIVRVIKAAADRVRESGRVSGDSSLDTDRASRICFVSGEPGAGKSTLYLSLRAMLSSKEESTYTAGSPKNIDLDKLQGAVKLLEPLDLEVAGEEGENLLAAVLVRLFKIFEESSSDHSKNCEDAIKKLEDLATDIGIAWEGNLQARAGALDPDTYSGEVMRTQRARLQVNERLRDALEDLAESNCYGCSKDTLFVLPVDDLYLKPSASLQLLRLLRMISIPRLFFLVMGDINTVEALFIEKSLADWTGVAGSALFARSPDRLDKALTRARELRARYLRKLLPPGQRTTIEAMDWDEAIDFEVVVQKKIIRLEDLLEEVNLDPKFPDCDGEKSSLLNFLVSPPFSTEEKENRQKQRETKKKGAIPEKKSPEEEALEKARTAYTALQILDAPPREIIDFGAALNEVLEKLSNLTLRNKNCTPVLLSSVRDIVNLVREEHSFLDVKSQEILEGVLPTRVYSSEDINFKMNNLALRIVARNWTVHNSNQVWFRRHRSWDLTVNNEKGVSNKEILEFTEEKEAERQKGSFDKLPPRPAAWFVLLHDLAWDWKPDSITGNPVERLCGKLNNWELLENENWRSNKADDPSSEPPANSKQRFYTKKEEDSDVKDYLEGWAVFYNGKSYEHFPLPNFDTFWKLDRFLHIWNCGLDRLAEDYTVTELIDLWRLAGWAIMSESDKEYENFSRETDEWFKTNTEILRTEKPEINNSWLDDIDVFSKKVKGSMENKQKL